MKEPKIEIAERPNNQARITIDMTDGSRATIKVYYDENKLTINTESAMIIQPHVSNEVEIYYIP